MKTQVSWNETRPGQTPGERMRREKMRLQTLGDLITQDGVGAARAAPSADDRHVPYTNVPAAATTPLTKLLSDTNARPSTPYQVALMFDGLREKTRDGVPNLMIDLFHDSTWYKDGAASDAWCSSFVNFCCLNVGFYATGSPRARSWTEHKDFRPSRGKADEFMREGDIIVFARGPNPAKGHVGFFIEVLNDKAVNVYGGNQSDMVKAATYRISDIIGYIPT